MLKMLLLSCYILVLIKNKAFLILLTLFYSKHHRLRWQNQAPVHQYCNLRGVKTIPSQIMRLLVYLS